MSSSPSQGQKRQWYRGEQSIAAFKAVYPGSIPSRRSFVLHDLKTESYHESRSCY
jgi:hypothetical protein